MDSDEPKQPDVGESTGQQLKRARERQGLSVKDVADAQHLRVSIIQAIEDADYDQIASELFLKGYVRAYAKQVGADADALIRNLDVELEPVREERAKLEQENPLVDIERRRRKKRQLAKALFVVLVLGAAAFAGWKFYLEPQQSEPQSENRLSSQSTGPMADQPPENASAQPETALVTETASSELATSTEGESGGVSPEPESPDPGSIDNTPSMQAEGSVEPETAVAETVVSERQAGDESPASDAEPAFDDPQELTATEEPTLGNEPAAELASVEPTEQPDPVFEESAQPQAVAAQARLQMSFEADCWVQVTDSSGARLVASLQRAGQQIDVSGRAPIQVVIGAVDAVGTVTFAGEQVDLSDFRVVNNRTEFTLSP